MESRPQLPLLRAIALALSVLFAAQVGAQQSNLSRWLSDEALPQLTDVLSAHPRFAGQPVQLTVAEPTGLDEALVTLLVGNLGAHEGIAITAPSRAASAPVASIDALACGAKPRQATLRLSSQRTGSRSGRVVLELADDESPGAAWRRWQWQGQYSREERDALSRPAAAPLTNGSLAAPWPRDAVAHAAAALAREFACDLRSQVRDRVALQWLKAGRHDARTGDVFNASQHLLGNLREVDVQEAGDFRIESRVERFTDGVLQLWLVGTPVGDGFSTVQAVTYMRDPGDVKAGSVAGAAGRAITVREPVVRYQAPPAAAPQPPLAARPPATPARDYLDVKMLDASQADGGFASADLAVQLRIENRGTWPIQYAFSVSGGHFLHCIADPANFRHDRYGYAEGEIAPGASLVRVIEVPGVEHKPNPWFGPRKCAGFKDLEGFENFPGKGYKVTEFLRWDI